MDGQRRDTAFVSMSVDAIKALLNWFTCLPANGRAEGLCPPQSQVLIVSYCQYVMFDVADYKPCIVYVGVLSAKCKCNQGFYKAVCDWIFCHYQLKSIVSLIYLLHFYTCGPAAVGRSLFRCYQTCLDMWVTGNIDKIGQEKSWPNCKLQTKII